MIRFYIALTIHKSGIFISKIFNSLSLGILDSQLRSHWSSRWYANNKWRYMPEDIAELEIIKFCKEQNIRSILDIGAGYGREARIFAQSGIRVVAFEKDAEMITFAQSYSSAHSSNTGTIEWICGDALSRDFKNIQVDLVYIGSMIYGHFSPQERKRLLSSAATALGAGGMLVLSYRGRGHGLLDQGYFHMLHLVACIASLITFKIPDFTPGDRLNNRFIAHSFTQGELQQELEQSGFHVIKFLRVKSVYTDIVFARTAENLSQQRTSRK